MRLRVADLYIVLVPLRDMTHATCVLIIIMIRECRHAASRLPDTGNRRWPADFRASGLERRASQASPPAPAVARFARGNLYKAGDMYCCWRQ